MKLEITRLSAQPLIRPHMDDRMGDNINSPSIIRVPDWVDRPLGAYYLYFADHKGRYIRLAYADSLLGPWTVHTPGVLDLEDSGFPAENPSPPTVEDRPDFAEALGDFLYAHIASPDVHILPEERRLRMYFHGLVENGDQFTKVAYSSDGLSFEVREPLLGPPYFRVFEHQNAFYTVPWGGAIWRSEHPDAPFEKGPTIIPLFIEGAYSQGFRHGECHKVGSTLHLFFHRIGDAPESILHAAVDLRGDWRSWKAGAITNILSPELAWEGGDLPATASVMGAVDERVRELRDPCIFVDDDGQTYLLYVGGGEKGIGIASIQGL